MHLILMTRGIKKEVDDWAMHMQPQYWNWLRQPLVTDTQGQYIKEGEDDNGQPIYRKATYQEDIINTKTKEVIYKKGEDMQEFSQVQGALRPIQLWEYVFPEFGVKQLPNGRLEKTENLKEVLAAMNIHDVVAKPLRKEMKPISWAIRKAFNAEPMPCYKDIVGKKPEQITNRRMFGLGGVATYPIGIKRDIEQDFIFERPDGSKKGYHQEGL